MLDWDDLRHLVAMADAGSLSAAARRLRVEHATVARRIAALEQAVGGKLVDRRGGRYALTALGQRVAAHARRMEEEALAVERAGLGSDADLVAEIAVTAPPTIASELIVPRLPELRRQHPALRLKIVGASQNLSLIRREADIALRLSRPDIPTLLVRKVGALDYGLFASARYLGSRLEADYAFVGLEEDLATAPQQIWLESVVAGRDVAFRSNDLTLQCAAVKADMGIAALPVFLGRSQGLSRVGDDIGISRDVWLTYHHDLKDNPAVGVVAAFLVSCLPKIDR